MNPATQRCLDFLTAGELTPFIALALQETLRHRHVRGDHMFEKSSDKES
jgi:hypothetical protein